jgi:hypothetical protein
LNHLFQIGNGPGRGNRAVKRVHVWMADGCRETSTISLNGLDETTLNLQTRTSIVGRFYEPCSALPERELKDLAPRIEESSLNGLILRSRDPCAPCFSSYAFDDAASAQRNVL